MSNLFKYSLSRNVVKMGQSKLLQKQVGTFEGVIAISLKQGGIIPQIKPFQRYQFQCEILVHFEVVLFEVTKCLILSHIRLFENQI